MISILIHDHPQDITQEELAQDLLLLPSWRRSQALKYHFLSDQVLCAKAYLLLCEALRRDYGIAEAPAFDYGAQGKPVLVDYPHIHFNISHTRHGVMCAVGDHPVGCDIEDIPPQLDLDLCRYCFSSQEVEGILTSENPTVAFTRLWTQKEALLKLTGEGLNDHLPTLLATDESRRATFTTVENPARGFVYTVCQYQPDAQD